MASNIFNESERFQKGRKLSRRLDDAAVARAKIKAMDKESSEILQELRDKQEPRIQAFRDSECVR